MSHIKPKSRLQRSAKKSPALQERWSLKGKQAKKAKNQEKIPSGHLEKPLADEV
jgi:hypothetical protein